MRCSFLLVLALAASPARCAERALRIGVFGLFRPQELVLKPAPGEALALEAGGVSLALEGAERARFRRSAGRVECLARGETWFADSIRVASRGGGPAGFFLSVPGKIERRFRGTLEVRGGGALAAVLTVDRELAVASVVAAESLPGAGLEALKAQAVAARSFYAAARARHDGFDFCDTTHCQFLREPPNPGDAPSVATTATRGLLLAYQGAPVAALYSASCGGRTRSLADPGPRDYPYFPVECSYCLRTARRWERRLEAAEAAFLLEGENSERARLQLGKKLGWSAVPGNNYRAALEGELWVLRGRGAGHGLGLCQLGAAAMAAEGAGFVEILRHYYPNTTLMNEDGR